MVVERLNEPEPDPPLANEMKVTLKNVFKRGGVSCGMNKVIGSSASPVKAKSF
jgi:hypothetical protein